MDLRHVRSVTVGGPDRVVRGELVSEQPGPEAHRFCTEPRLRSQPTKEANLKRMFERFGLFFDDRCYYGAKVHVTGLLTGANRVGTFANAEKAVRQAA